VLLKAWTGLAGTSTVALRLPSVLAMAVTAGLVSVLGSACCRATGRVPTGRWGGLLAGAGFAVVPMTSRYAQEARPYAFVILFAVLASLLLVRLVERPAPARAVAYAAAILLLGAFHVVSLLLLVGHAVPVLATLGRRTGPAEEPTGRHRTVLVAWACATGAALVLLLPLAWLGRRQRAQISWISPAHWQTLVNTPSTLFGSGLVAGALVILAALALIYRWRSGPPAGRGAVDPVILLTAWAVGPILALYLIAKLTPLFWPRYLLYTMPAVVLLATLALIRLKKVEAAGVVAVIAVLGVPAQQGFREVDGHNHATSQAAGIIAAGERPGDAIAYALHEPVVPWEARDIVARYVPADRRPDDVFAVTAQRTDGQLLATECPDPASCLDRADPDRIWVLRYQNLGDPLAGIGEPKQQLLQSRYHLQSLWLVRGLTVALLAHD
jgi:mannosyltransferase